MQVLVGVRPPPRTPRRRPPSPTPRPLRSRGGAEGAGSVGLEDRRSATVRARFSRASRSDSAPTDVHLPVPRARNLPASRSACVSFAFWCQFTTSPSPTRPASSAASGPPAATTTSISSFGSVSDAGHPSTVSAASLEAAELAHARGRHMTSITSSSISRRSEADGQKSPRAQLFVKVLAHAEPEEEPARHEDGGSRRRLSRLDRRVDVISSGRSQPCPDAASRVEAAMAPMTPHTNGLSPDGRSTDGSGRRRARTRSRPPPHAARCGRDRAEHAPRSKAHIRSPWLTATRACPRRITLPTRFRG